MFDGYNLALVNKVSRNNRTRSEQNGGKVTTRTTSSVKGVWVKTESACLGAHGSLVNTIK